MADPKVGIIHEIGNYSPVQELNEEQQEQYRQQLINEEHGVDLDPKED